jgi:hypothetical protein
MIAQRWAINACQRYLQHTKSPYAVTAYGIGILKFWYASDGILCRGICRHISLAMTGGNIENEQLKNS